MRLKKWSNERRNKKFKDVIKFSLFIKHVIVSFEVKKIQKVKIQKFQEQKMVH